MDIFDLEFKRKFSFGYYKNLKIKLGKMSFLSDFINTDKGDLYPVIYRSEDCKERVENGQYVVESGNVERLFCQFFPFATYSLFASANGAVGFAFSLPFAKAYVTVKNGCVCYECGEHKEEIDAPIFANKDFTLIVSCRPSAFDIYAEIDEKTQYVCTIFEQNFALSNDYNAFSNGYVHLVCKDNACVKEVLSYIDNGISVADIRSIKYENGEVMQEGGKVYFTVSVRMQEGTFQGVISWIPTTAEFDFVGAIFYDCGDGVWRNYVAPVMIFDRINKVWRVWAVSHEHILSHGEFVNDLRFGVNVLDVKLMDKATENSAITDFVGFKGDEDPDLFFDEESKRWLFAVCRIDDKTKQYSYYFFSSTSPDSGFAFIGKGYDGAETGGSFVRIDGKLYFVCGNNYKAKSEYRVYGKDGMRNAKFNYPDGGFRGWGTVVPIKAGSRTRYFWLTFDRCKASHHTWSYGNLYCFEV